MLRKCLDCGHAVNEQATLCPQCGRRDPAERHLPPTLKAAMILAGLALITWIALRGGG